MKSNYEAIKEYYAQKGYEGASLEKAAYSTTAKVEAIKVGIDIVQPVAVHAGLDALTTVSEHEKVNQ